MKKLRFHRYKMNRLVSVRQLSSVHYFADVQYYDTPVHSHSTWEFVFCDKGHVTVWDDVRRIELGAGEIAFHQTGVPHHIHVGATPTTMFLVSFACTNECKYRNTECRTFLACYCFNRAVIKICEHASPERRCSAAAGIWSTPAGR